MVKTISLNYTLNKRISLCYFLVVPCMLYYIRSQLAVESNGQIRRPDPVYKLLPGLLLGIAYYGLEQSSPESLTR